MVKFTTRWVEGIRALLRAWELGKQAGDDQRQLLQQRLAEEKYEGNTDFSWKCGILQAHSANEAHSVKQKEARKEAKRMEKLRRKQLKKEMKADRRSG